MFTPEVTMLLNCTRIPSHRGLNVEYVGDCAICNKKIPKFFSISMIRISMDNTSRWNYVLFNPSEHENHMKNERFNKIED